MYPLKFIAITFCIYSCSLSYSDLVMFTTTYLFTTTHSLPQTHTTVFSSALSHTCEGSAKRCGMHSPGSRSFRHSSAPCNKKTSEEVWLWAPLRLHLLLSRPSPILRSFSFDRKYKPAEVETSQSLCSLCS